MGTGPERSLFIGNNKINSAIKVSNTFFDKFMEFRKSGKPKQANDVWFGAGLERLWSGDLPNMQLVFMGSYNFSFYKLGDKTLSIAQDVKSRTSANLHLLKSYSREQGVPYFDMDRGPIRSQRQTNTHQTYIFFVLDN